MSRDGKVVNLGYFAEEAALCIARSPEAQVAAVKAAARGGAAGKAVARWFAHCASLALPVGLRKENCHQDWARLPLIYYFR